jgi:hypothetical protein
MTYRRERIHKNDRERNGKRKRTTLEQCYRKPRKK